MKTKTKNKQEKGITLIALVVTIVVLLILAGVSISLVLSNNGVISKAKDARNQYAEAQTNDEKQLNEVSDWIDTKVSNYDPASEGVIIPDGYYYVGGTKEKGIVISDNANDKELDKGKEDVRRDLAGNQWVWVPVETPSILYTTEDAGVALDGGMGVKTTKYTNSKIISEQERCRPGNIRKRREPDVLINMDNKYATEAFSSYKNMAETLVSEYDEMIRSLEKYHGFYIGRYELSENGEKTGVTQINKNWYENYKVCTTLAKEGTEVKTRMIWGLQWDATCNWLESSGFDITDSKDWGNIGNATLGRRNTGFSESWKANNIYDFAGNCWEFTQEAESAYYRVCRGVAYYNGGGASGYITYKNSEQDPEATRPTLYLIP